MQEISFPNLALAFIPVAVVVGLIHRWGLDSKHSIHAVLRMLAQLLLVGYALTFLFTTEQALLVLAVIMVMILAASWIALGALPQQRLAWIVYALISIFLGGVLTLLLTTQGVLELKPWYQPRFFIPLAGMIFANAMNSVSLAAERWIAEIERGIAWAEARNIAFRASLIPITNSLFAVGLVSLPGMMTGQILSGVSPLVAVRYQIMVMCMIYGSAGISAAIFLTLVSRQTRQRRGGKEGIP
jgi:putative ABC transport system permease protein